MSLLLYIAITLGTFAVMEAVTWFTHKYVMHGLLWVLHEDHHQPRYTSVFEKNDLFFVIFALPSILLFYFGVEDGLNFRFFIGLGILMYGIAYFMVHDVIIHRRFRWLDRVKNPYIRALRKAHKVHHKHLDKEDGECFGMLVVPWKYVRDAFR